MFPPITGYNLRHDVRSRSCRAAQRFALDKGDEGFRAQLDARATGGGEDFGLIPGRNEPAFQPPLHGAAGLADGFRQWRDASKEDDDAQGRRISTVPAFPQDGIHTHTYARNVFAVNVESVRPLRDYAAMKQNQGPVGAELRRLYERSGLTLAELAALMGYRGASSLQRYLEPDYLDGGLLPVKLASRFAKALAGRGTPPISAQDVFDLAGLELTASGSARPIESEANVQNASVLQFGADVQSLMARAVARDLPIYGTALGADLETTSVDGDRIAVEQCCLDTSEVVDFVQRPFAMNGKKNAYAVIISGTSMFPRYDDGQIAVADPSWPARPGDDVIVQIRSPDGCDEDGRVTLVMVKRLVRRSAAWVELEQFTPAQRFRVETARIKAIHRILQLGDIVNR